MVNSRRVLMWKGMARTVKQWRHASKLKRDIRLDQVMAEVYRVAGKQSLRLLSTK
jgi:hypothetical protein